jgi:hypothetical protein
MFLAKIRSPSLLDTQQATASTPQRPSRSACQSEMRARAREREHATAGRRAANLLHGLQPNQRHRLVELRRHARVAHPATQHNTRHDTHDTQHTRDTRRDVFRHAQQQAVVTVSRVEWGYSIPRIFENNAGVYKVSGNSFSQVTLNRSSMARRILAATAAACLVVAAQALPWGGVADEVAGSGLPLQVSGRASAGPGGRIASLTAGLGSAGERHLPWPGRHRSKRPNTLRMWHW